MKGKNEMGFGLGVLQLTQCLCVKKRGISFLKPVLEKAFHPIMANRGNGIETVLHKNIWVGNGRVVGW